MRMDDLGVAVVTGGSRGLGHAIVARLGEDGWRVVVADVAPDPQVGVPSVSLDIVDRIAVADVFDQIEGEHGPIALLVNNAGIQVHMALADGEPSAWDKVMAVNLGGTFNCLRDAGARMVSRGEGAIVNLSSVAAVRGGVERAAYNASKAAVNSLTMSAAVEWAAAGVRVNAVGPGYTDTDLLARAIESGAVSIDRLLGHIPMRTFGRPADIGAAVSFLASADARYVTGQILYVDGGFLADYGVS